MRASMCFFVLLTTVLNAQSFKSVIIETSKPNKDFCRFKSNQKIKKIEITQYEFKDFKNIKDKDSTSFKEKIIIHFDTNNNLVKYKSKDNLDETTTFFTYNISNELTRIKTVNYFYKKLIGSSSIYIIYNGNTITVKGSSKYSNKDVYITNKKGLITSKKVYSVDGIITEDYTHKYNKKGDLIKKMSFNEKYKDYFYNSKGKLYKEVFYYNGKITTTLYGYNQKGLLSYSKNKSNYFFSADENKKYKYDNNNCLIEKKDDYYRRTYKYNENKNWIERKSYFNNSDVPETITFRKITYY